MPDVLKKIEFLLAPRYSWDFSFAENRASAKNVIIPVAMPIILACASGCTIIDLPNRIDSLEARQEAFGETVGNLATRYAALDGEVKELAERQDRVESWLRRLRGRTPAAAPTPTGRPATAELRPAVAQRQYVQNGREKVLFDNQTKHHVRVRLVAGPGASPESRLNVWLLPASEAPQTVLNEQIGLASPGEHLVPCGSRLVGTSTADMLVFVDAEIAGTCR